jgi:hypothetical protein
MVGDGPRFVLIELTIDEAVDGAPDVEIGDDC